MQCVPGNAHTLLGRNLSLRIALNDKARSLPLAQRWVVRKNIRHMDRRFFLNTAALRIFPRGTNVTKNQVDPLDHYLLLPQIDPKDFAPRATVIPGDHFDDIIHSDITGHRDSTSLGI